MKQQRLPDTVWRTHLPLDERHHRLRNHAVDAKWKNGTVITRCGQVFEPGTTVPLQTTNGARSWSDCGSCSRLLRKDRSHG